MSKLLLQIALLFIFAPISAQIAEPFFGAVLSAFGVDPKLWAHPAMTWLSWVTNHPYFLPASVFFVGLGLGIWLHRLAVKHDLQSPKERSAAMPTTSVFQTDWAIGLKAFSIKDAACALAGVTPSGWPESARAQAITVDMLSQVSNGYLGTPEDYAARVGVRGGHFVGHPQFTLKPTVSVDMIVDARSVADFAIERGISADWLLAANVDFIGTNRRDALQKKRRAELTPR